ncbi:MAG: sigma-70 family RNA polymerase sigma factor [Firmicutes bacterium]|nr:sigma-70 family RNA polymerase sigma factor [Bacillota bacterium]
MTENDAGLIARARDGDTAAIAALATTYSTQVFRLARYLLQNEEDARDAAADVFVRLYSAREKIPLEGFKPWLMRVTYNHCQDILRRKNTLKRLLPKILQVQKSSVVRGPEQLVVEADERAEIRQAVNALPEIDRMVVVLRYYHQLSYTEISQTLDIPEATVGTRLHRAREKLKSRLAGQKGGGVGCDVQKAVPGGNTLMKSFRRPNESGFRTTC